MDDFNGEHDNVNKTSAEPSFDVDELRATDAEEQLSSTTFKNEIMNEGKEELERVEKVECEEKVDGIDTDEQIRVKYHPLMEPEKGNKKRGLFFIVAISSFVLLFVCITLILLRNHSSLVSSTYNKLVSIVKNESTKGEDTNALSNTIKNGSVSSDLPCEVILGEYLGITVTAQKANVTEDEVEAELAQLISQNPILIDIMERSVVQLGDIVTIDYVGSVDGVAFDGGSDSGFPLEIGAGNFIEGFEEQIIGHKLGENFDIQVTFPESYAEELSGKEAVFNITIRGIGYYETAKANDDFIAANTEYKTLEEYKKGTYETLLESAKQAAESKMESDIINTAINNATFINISLEEVESKKAEMLSEYESYAGYYGLDLATFASYYFGMDEETFYSEMAKAAEIQVKTNYFLKEVLKKEGIVLTEEEYKSGVEEYAQVNGFMTTEEFETYYGREIIEEFLVMNKAYDIIINSAIINE